MNRTTSLGGEPVRRIGLGAMQLAGPGVFGPPADMTAARAVLQRAIECGVDHIDTAQYYGPDVVNDLIREALHPYPADLRLATKVGWRRDGAGNVLPAQAPQELRAGVEANLRSLRVERLAVVNLRLPDGGGTAPIGLEDQLGALEDLRRQGKVELIGLSNVDRPTLEKGLALVDVACVQNGYSLIDRRGDDVLALCRQRELPFVPFGPLGSAYRRGPAQLGAESVLPEIANKHHATTAQIALAWLLAHYERMLLIPGTSSVAHLEENLAAIEIRLDDIDLAALDRMEPRP